MPGSPGKYRISFFLEARNKWWGILLAVSNADSLNTIAAATMKPVELFDEIQKVKMAAKRTSEISRLGCNKRRNYEG